jgi:hypothetical protein
MSMLLTETVSSHCVWRFEVRIATLSKKSLTVAAIANACDQNGKLPVRHAAATRWWASLAMITTLFRFFVNDPTREQSYTCPDEKREILEDSTTQKMSSKRGLDLSYQAPTFSWRSNVNGKREMYKQADLFFADSPFPELFVGREADD